MAKHVGNNLCIEDKSRLASKLWKAVAERDEARELLRVVVDTEWLTCDGLDANTICDCPKCVAWREARAALERWK